MNFPNLNEVWSYGQGEVKAAHIPVTGVIMRGGEETLLGHTPDMVESVLQADPDRAQRRRGAGLDRGSGLPGRRRDGQ
jgi:hypothetical protein